MRDSNRTLNAILEASERVILKNGVARTTLDDIAKEAAVSKGGVLHHFPSKEAVLVGVLQGLITRFEAEIENHRSQDQDPRGAFTRAFLSATLKPDASCVDLFLALCAAYAYTPALLDLHRECNSRWQRKLESDGIDPIQASLVRFAADGLWLARIHGVAAPSEDVRKALIDSLLAMTYAETEPAMAGASSIKRK